MDTEGLELAEKVEMSERAGEGLGDDHPTTENLLASIPDRFHTFVNKTISDPEIAEMWKPFCSVRAWDEGYREYGRENAFAAVLSPPH